MKEEERFKEFEILLPEISDEEIISTLFPHLFDNNQNLSENLEEINTNNVNKELNNENLNKNEENIEENEINNIKEILQSQIINNKKLFSFSDFEIFIQQKLFHEEKFFQQQAENFLYELENRFRNSTSTPIESRNMLLMDIYQIVNKNKKNKRELELHKQITQQICNINQLLVSNLINSEKQRMKMEWIASIFHHHFSLFHLEEIKEKLSKNEEHFYENLFINIDQQLEKNNSNDQIENENNGIAMVLSKFKEILSENFLIKEKMEKMEEMMKLREDHFIQQLKSKEIELKFLSAKFRQQIENSAQQSLLLAKTYQEKMKGNERREKNLRNQLKNYAEKFEQFQETLLKSSDMTKTIKRLEKDKISLQKKGEQTDFALIDIADQRNMQRKEIERLNTKIARLEAVCRLLQSERRKLAKLPPLPLPLPLPLSPSPPSLSPSLSPSPSPSPSLSPSLSLPLPLSPSSSPPSPSPSPSYSSPLISLSSSSSSLADNINNNINNSINNNNNLNINNNDNVYNLSNIDNIYNNINNDILNNNSNNVIL